MNNYSHTEYVTVYNNEGEPLKTNVSRKIYRRGNFIYAELINPKTYKPYKSKYIFVDVTLSSRHEVKGNILDKIKLDKKDKIPVGFRRKKEERKYNKFIK